MRQLLKSFAIQCRVVGALLMRETYTRFGRENLGFAWMFGEFLIFALPVIAMWRIIRGHYEHGLLVVPFVWSGYFPILLFRHIGGRMLFAVRGNIALLYHRNVTPFDTVLARIALEIMGNYMAAVFAFFMFYATGAMAWPRNMPLLFLGYFYMTWWCVAVGLVIAAFSERTAVFEKLWAPVSYMYLPVSGFFYMAAWLPPTVRNVLLVVMPALPAYDMIRGGLFGPVIRTYYNIPQLSFILASITLFGLLGLRDVRRYIINE
ncbi:MAG TPA: capsule biosynthesis protein [Stellaceae bacterium]|nr:capsule biosynthesis protein [Stellaceae bacterium]